MLNVIATIRAQPAHGDAVADLMKTLAMAGRAEQGCRRYRVFRCAEDATLFTTFEQWADAAAETRHMGSAHIATAFAAAGSLLAAAPDIRHFNEV
ncbi:MAG TPA: putative quinol monooxygenase [Rudaea sp.]